MKKIFYFIAAALLTAISFASCQDDDPELAQQSTNAQKLKAKANGQQAEYTICMYGCSGGNLDAGIVQELLDNAPAVVETKGKVRFVGIYKPAKGAMSELGENGGTRYFELKFKDGVDTAKVNRDWYRINDLDKDTVKQRNLALKLFNEDFVNEKYADADLRLYTPANMAEALKFLTDMAPAKKYILLTNNHGGGWSLADDKPMQHHTRAMVFDDNNNDKGISLDQLNEGVKQSGVKFDALFCDLCLMGTLENLYGYSESFPICIASAETTTSSWFGHLVTRLAIIGGNATHDQLFQQCSQWATTTDTAAFDGYRTWETMKDVKGIDAKFQDMGCYDLTKISNLTAPLRNITNWYTKAMANKQLKYIVEKSVLTTLYTTMPNPNKATISFYRQNAVDVLKKAYGQNMTCDSLAGKIADGKDEDMYKIITKCSDKKAKTYYEEQAYMTSGYPMAYFVWNTIRIAKQQGDTKTASELQTLLDSYTTALKSMSRIQCSYYDYQGSRFDGVDYPAMDPYLWTSPTVTITSLSKYGFQYVTALDYSPWAYKGLSLSDAISAYNNTKFDQTTGWSKFLQQLDVNPNVVTNIWRNAPVYYSKFGM